MDQHIETFTGLNDSLLKLIDEQMKPVGALVVEAALSFVHRFELSPAVCVLDPLLHPLSPARARSLAALSLVSVSILQVFMSRLHVSLKRRADRPTRRLLDAR